MRLAAGGWSGLRILASSPPVQAGDLMIRASRGACRSVSMSLVRKLALVAVGAIGLAGCSTYDPYYGASIGVGTRYYDPHYSYGYGNYPQYGGYARYGAYGVPYGSYGANYGSYGGWNSGYYYPGTGAYVYDRQRRRYPISNAQRRHWEQQRVLRSRNPAVQENYRQYRAERRDDRRDYRNERREDRAARDGGQLTREEYRADRRHDRREYRQDQRQDTRQLRRENRKDRRRPR
jgi:hypothetical protein